VDSQRFAAVPVACRPPLPVKIVIAGGIGAGKTTAVTQISEIPVVTIEAPMTEVVGKTDHASERTTSEQIASEQATSPNVVLDFGSITIDEGVKLCLLGTPAHDRSGFAWRGLTAGALGALVIVDSRRPDEGLGAVAHLERAGLPFVVAINLFDGERDHQLDDPHWGLPVADGTPVIAFDARDRGSVLDALLAVLRRRLAMIR
jgi:signal recognition particle receptor subunit beta